MRSDVLAYSGDMHISKGECYKKHRENSMFRRAAPTQPITILCITCACLFTYSGVQRHTIRGESAHIQGSIFTRCGEYDHKIGGLSLLKAAPSNAFKLLKYVKPKVVSKNTKATDKGIKITNQAAYPSQN